MLHSPSKYIPTYPPHIPHFCRIFLIQTTPHLIVPIIPTQHYTQILFPLGPWAMLCATATPAKATTRLSTARRLAPRKQQKVTKVLVSSRCSSGPVVCKALGALPSAFSTRDKALVGVVSGPTTRTTSTPKLSPPHPLPHPLPRS